MPAMRHDWHPVAQNLNGLEKGNVGYGQIPKGEHFVQGHLPKSRCHNGGIDLLVTKYCNHSKGKSICLPHKWQTVEKYQKYGEFHVHKVSERRHCD